MISTIEARNNRGGLLTLELEDVTDGLVLEDVQGLDPVKATIVASSFAQQDGAQYHTSYLESRDLSIFLALEPDDPDVQVRDLRSRLYDFFMPKSEVSIRLYDDSGLTVDISGRVESMPAPLFVRDPKATINIRCLDPDFIDVESGSLEEDTTDTTDEELLEYPGTVNTGFIFVINIDRDVDELTIYHRTPSGSINQMDISVDMVDGDILTINTNEGAKSAILTHALSDNSVLYGVSTQATWHQLERGENYIRVFTEGDPIPYEITYTPRYGGL